MNISNVKEAQKPGRQRVDQIPLAGGGHTLVDPCDAHLARQYKWRRGVVFHPAQKKYQARIERLGIFRGPYRETAEEAALDADQLLRALYGDVATYNFPREGERAIERAKVA